MYDDATGNIFYSLCNSTDIPVFPADDSAAFDLKFAPLSGTGLGGMGYMEKDHLVVSNWHCHHTLFPFPCLLTNT